MKITNKQIQAIQDELDHVEKMTRKLIGKQQNPLEMTITKQGLLNYWIGRKNSLIVIIEILGI